MICQSCGDKGMIRVPWNNAPDDFAICLCQAGAWYRSEWNAGRWTGYCGWQVWAAMRDIDPSHIFLMEEVLTPAELAERGFSQPAELAEVMREAALLAAGKTRKARL